MIYNITYKSFSQQHKNRTQNLHFMKKKKSRNNFNHVQTDIPRQVDFTTKYLKNVYKVFSMGSFKIQIGKVEG